MDGIDGGKSPSLLSSIGDREDIDFHDDNFVQHCDVSSSYSSEKSLKIRLHSSSNSTDVLRMGSHVPVSSSQENTYAPRESSDSSMSIMINSAARKNDNDNPIGVSVGGQSQISKYTERGTSPHRTDANRKSTLSEAHSFFSRAYTGIRSGSQSSMAGGQTAKAPVLPRASSNDREADSDDKHGDFFSRALTGIRSGPQRAHDDDKREKARKLENKLQQMTQKSKKFDNRLKDLGKKISSAETKPKEVTTVKNNTKEIGTKEEVESVNDSEMYNGEDVCLNVEEDNFEDIIEVKDEDIVGEIVEVSPRLSNRLPGNKESNSQYSYEDLQRRTVKSSPGSSRDRVVSVTKDYSKDIVQNFANREDLLRDDEFESIFGMSREKFDNLPKWRRQELKKRYKLF